MRRYVFLILKLAILGLILIAIFLPGISRYHRLLEEEEQKRQTIERLVEANKQLEREQQMLKQDPVYIERVARRKLGIAREGEIVVRFKEEK